MKNLIFVLALACGGIFPAHSQDAIAPNNAENKDMLQTDLEGIAHFYGDKLSIIITNTSGKRACVRLGELSSDAVLIESPTDKNTAPTLKLDFLFGCDWVLQLVWPVKRGSKLVICHEMLQLESKSEKICSAIKENMIQVVDVEIVLIEMPLGDGEIKTIKRVVRCPIKIHESDK